jgi:hypothetical protein
MKKKNTHPEHEMGSITTTFIASGICNRYVQGNSLHTVKELSLESRCKCRSRSSLLIYYIKSDKQSISYTRITAKYKQGNSPVPITEQGLTKAHTTCT